MCSEDSIDSLIKKDFSDINLPRPNFLTVEDNQYLIFDEDFECKKLLGKGQFAVQKYLHNPSRMEFAVKEFPIPKKKNIWKKRVLKMEELRKIFNEIEIFNRMSVADREHIVQFYGWTWNNDYIKVYMEPMHISLKKLIEMKYRAVNNLLLYLKNSTNFEFKIHFMKCRTIMLRHSFLFDFIFLYVVYLNFIIFVLSFQYHIFLDSKYVPLLIQILAFITTVKPLYHDPMR